VSLKTLINKISVQLRWEEDTAVLLGRNEFRRFVFSVFLRPC
jgi:hypothetical protein